MTLADLIRKYLEDRRRTCEQKAQCLDSDNFQFYTDHNQDDSVITLSNNQFFSNNLDPKRNDQSRGSSSKTYQKSIGVSRSSRITTLPDGTIQVETIIRDSNGKEEKHVTYHKDGKKYTTITRKGPSGEEEVEEKVGESSDVEVFPGDRFIVRPFSGSTNPDLDSGYDHWYNKLFKENKPNMPADEWSNGITTFDPSTNVDEQMEKILKGFGFEGFFGSLPRIPKSNNGDDGTSFDDGVFTEFNDSTINEEMRKMFENFRVMDFNQGNSQVKKGSNKKLERQIDKIFKSITPPKPPSMFEQFAEEAYADLPEENTPLDKFVEPDEERLNKLKSIRQRSRDMLQKLEKYLGDKPDNSLQNDIYSDIEDTKDLDFSLMMPEPLPEFPPTIPNFGNVLRKTFDPDKFTRFGNIRTQMYFGDGKKRTESISKDKDGNTEKNILYEIGNQKYNVKIVTNRFGMEVKREKSFNFPEHELPKFRKQWGREFVSDFIKD